MTSKIVQYRVHPSWFRGEDINVMIKELAEQSAQRRGAIVSNIAITGNGEDRGGRYINVDVTYTTHTAIVELMR
jgi:hypothetical protein